MSADRRRSRPRPLLTHHLPALAWAGLIAAAMSAPAPPAPAWQGWLDRHVDKVGHFAVFAVMAALAARSIGAPAPAGWRRRLARRPWGWAVALTIAYGGATELIQLGVAGRGAEWADLAADAGGALCAAGLGLLSGRPAGGRARRAGTDADAAEAVRGGPG